MSLQEFSYRYPADALDTSERPTFWPHDPEEQVGYVEPEATQRPPTQTEPTSGHTKSGQ